jgi:catechol 2,3-dioxygenase-like lactoylglutathione lyase family enzyme
MDESSAMPGVSGINHITFAVGDLARSLAFYRDVLGMRVVARWPRGAYLEAGGDWFALLEGDEVDAPRADYTHVALSAFGAEYEQIAQRVRDSGATIWQQNRSEGPSLYFLDPDGHKLELHASDLAARLDEARRRPWDPQLELGSD